MLPDHDNSDTLPSPVDRPEGDVVIYDGACRMCRGQMRRLHWWDRRGRLAFISLHAPEVRQRWPDLPHDRLMQEIAVITHNGRQFWGPTAIRYLTRRVPSLWWAMPLLHIPGSMVLWRRLYRWVARNRYWFAGTVEECDDAACALHR